MVNSKNSIKKYPHLLYSYIVEKLESFALKTALVGISLFIPSIVFNDSFITFILDRIGEAFIIAGVIAYFVERHHLSLIIKGTSKSIIDEIINQYFTRNQVIDFILECTKKLNSIENIDEELYDLYSEHGILELANEPQRSGLSIVLEKFSDSDTEENKFILRRKLQYTAKNEANIENRYKLINEDGMVSFLEFPLDEINNVEEIINNISNDINFEFFSSFEIENSNSNHERVNIKPIFLDKNDFDMRKCKPKQHTNLRKFKPQIYALYETIRKSPDKTMIRFEFIFNVKIPPQQNLQIFLDIIYSASYFDIFTYEFISYTKGVLFRLDLGKEFETKIGEVLIGAPTVFEKSDTEISHDGWIMPHSSITATWKRLNIE